MSDIKDKEETLQIQSDPTGTKVVEANVMIEGKTSSDIVAFMPSKMLEITSTEQNQKIVLCEQELRRCNFTDKSLSLIDELKLLCGICHYLPYDPSVIALKDVDIYFVVDVLLIIIILKMR